MHFGAVDVPNAIHEKLSVATAFELGGLLYLNGSFIYSSRGSLSATVQTPHHLFRFVADFCGFVAQQIHKNRTRRGV